MPIEARSDHLIGQWLDSPVLRASIDAPVGVANEDVLPALERLQLMHRIDDAEGVWLDYLGVRLGVRRPATSDPAQDDRFGFDLAGLGFGQAPFRGDVANDSVYPLPDAIFRCFIKARAILDLADGTIQTFTKAVRCIDPSASVQDNRNMSVRVVTVRREALELADEIGALPRTAGVKIIWADVGRFGFDSAGVPFDVGPFSGIV